jgi:hypothetical protein
MQYDPAGLAIAKMWEDRGYTSPDKHDLLMACLGQRVRVAEIRQRPAPDNRIEVGLGETTLAKIKQMICSLPDTHHLGIVTVAIGKGNSYRLVEFLTKQAKLKNFTIMSAIGPLTEKEIFDGFFDRLAERRIENG